MLPILINIYESKNKNFHRRVDYHIDIKNHFPKIVFTNGSDLLT